MGIPLGIVAAMRRHNRIRVGAQLRSERPVVPPGASGKGTAPAEGPAVASGPARWRASLWDYVLIVVWIAVLSAVGALVRTRWSVDLPTGPVWVTDVFVFLITVLPVWGYLTVSEGGVRQASWGKTRAGLRVVSLSSDGAMRLGRSAARNAVKLLPWQLAHVAVARLILGAPEPVVIGAAYASSVAVALVSLVVAWRDPRHRGLHDFVAGTRVVHA